MPATRSASETTCFAFTVSHSRSINVRESHFASRHFHHYAPPTSDRTAITPNETPHTASSTTHSPPVAHVSELNATTNAWHGNTRATPSTTTAREKDTKRDVAQEVQLVQLHVRSSQSAGCPLNHTMYSIRK